MTRIPVWDYLPEYDELKHDISSAVAGVFESGRLILGENVSTFETDFAAYCDCRYGIGVNSGTDALMLALKALGVGPGDEVITVPNTAVPTVAAIENAGGRARFVDISAGTMLMDPSLLEAAITPATKVILPVHLYGQNADMAAIGEIAAKHGLKLLEDCAQSTGSSTGERKSGSFGDLAAFSFYPTKLLGAYGDGGMVTTADEGLADRLRSLRMYGMKGRYYADEHGYNSRLDEVQAAILRVKLAHLDGWIERRRHLAARYDRALAGLGLDLPAAAPGNRHAYYLYVVAHDRRDEIMQGLAAADIHVNISYPWPIHVMTGYRHLGYGQGDFPVSEAAAKRIFSLPMYHGLTDEQQDRVIEVLTGLLDDGSGR
jgi:aminotransferase EvaB